MARHKHDHRLLVLLAPKELPDHCKFDSLVLTEAGLEATADPKPHSRAGLQRAPPRLHVLFGDETDDVSLCKALSCPHFGLEGPRYRVVLRHQKMILMWGGHFIW